MKLILNPDLPLSTSVRLAEAWFDSNSRKRRHVLEHGLRRDGHDGDSIEEALCSFDENDAECRGEFLNQILDAIADIRAGVDPAGGVTIQ